MVLVNGPGLNDIAQINTDDDAAIWRVVGAYGVNTKIVNDALSSLLTYGETNDAVMCGMIPFPDGTSLEQSAIKEMNRLLRVTSNASNVPMALQNGEYVGGYSDTGTHPDAAGTTWIAEQIAGAYESNLVANKIITGTSVFGPKRSIYGGN